MQDPLMCTLFDMRNPEAAVSPEEHGERLGLYFLVNVGDDDEYI